MANIFQENVSLVFHIARRVAMHAWSRADLELGSRLCALIFVRFVAAEFGQTLFGDNGPQAQAQTCCGNGVQSPSVQ